jgi:hypothetical protein
MPKRTILDQDLKSTYPLSPSTIEDIDQALFNYLNEDLTISCTSNQGFTKVPVIFASPERSFTIKEHRDVRSNDRVLEYPLIAIVRGNMVKNPQNKGRYGVYVPPFYDYYNRKASIPIARRVMQGKTRERANATALRRFGNGTDTTYGTFPFDNQKIVYETLMVPYPTFIEIEYEVKFISSYQQQMNEMLAPVLSQFSTPAVFSIKHEGNIYEAFVNESLANESNNADLQTEERLFKTTVNIKVLGHLVGADVNQETPNVVVRESAAEVTIGRERTIVGDEPEFQAGRKDKYRR